MQDVRGLIGIAAQWMRFAVVGVSNTALSWCAFALLTAVGVPYGVASALAYVLGGVNSYALNRRWTFRARGRHGPALMRFGVVQTVGLAVDLALLDVLIDARMEHLIAQALVFGAASGLTFVLSRQWAFAGVRSAT